jgi:PST family polysaccharide transporter
MVMFPPLAAAAVLARELIIGLYGPEWSAAVVPFAILCSAGMIRSVSLLTGVVFKGIGRPEVEMRWSVSGLAAAALFVLIGIQWGLPGAAAGLATASLLIWIPTQISACRLLRLPSLTFFKGLLEPLVATVLAVAAAYLLRTGLNMLDLPEIAVALLALFGALGATWLATRSFAWFKSVREIEGLASSSLLARLRKRRGVTPEQEDDS